LGRRARLAAAASLLLLTARPSAAEVIPGLDVLREEKDAYLEGRRVGLITNHTGLARDGTSALTILRDELHLNVVALFSPEHGFAGDIAAGDEVRSGYEPTSGVPIHSLYGETRAPTAEMLSGVDVLVFDVQDVGVRFYTYISTMKLAMEAAAEHGVDFVVLDRPNPNGGVRIEGPVLDARFSSFVGVASIPLVHGMTVAELAKLFAADLPALELHVVPMKGWRREMLWVETGLPWRAPSPNIGSPEAALAYPALGLIEGINASEGRGTEKPFEQTGAPFVDGETVVERLVRLALPGVDFHPVSFVPRSTAAAPRPKYLDERCHGVELDIADVERFEAVRTGLAIVQTMRSLYPDSFQWVKRGERFWIDLLLGTDRPRLGLEAGTSLEVILEAEGPDLERFRRRREPFLLY
jgi:uncharacterized protein YbbC (DUF1343 family)